MVLRGPGLPVPHRRTFTAAILASVHSEASALAYPACAGRLRRLSGHGQPLAVFLWWAGGRGAEPDFL